jgi:hypothetical protein
MEKSKVVRLDEGQRGFVIDHHVCQESAGDGGLSTLSSEEIYFVIDHHVCPRCASELNVSMVEFQQLSLEPPVVSQQAPVVY